MKTSFIALLVAQALVATASQLYCNGGTALASGNTCAGKGANSYCCRTQQTSAFPTFRGLCFSPRSVSRQEDTSQSCADGSVYCCD
ncbi:hypothetical protein IFR05_016249 [Cadophora sp. M221]|nr:hypothetical protein IFR05_016249 [Cadophora sp. M221]